LERLVILAEECKYSTAQISRDRYLNWFLPCSHDSTAVSTSTNACLCTLWLKRTENRR
jgi:ferredoxin-thioredoxin reductase catalytic subunit